LRLTDWDVLDLSGDPTPGSPWGARALSARLGSVGDDAADAERGARSLAGDQAVLTWIGAAGDVFRGAIDDFPGQLAKLADSYHRCSAALSEWAGDLNSAQGQVDGALVKARAARARMDSLQGQLSAQSRCQGCRRRWVMRRRSWTWRSDWRGTRRICATVRRTGEVADP
jgi:uncharacterized protein YukE